MTKKNDLLDLKLNDNTIGITGMTRAMLYDFTKTCLRIILEIYKPVMSCLGSQGNASCLMIYLSNYTYFFLVKTIM
jgi:hypothetical protein